MEKNKYLLREILSTLLVHLSFERTAPAPEGKLAGQGPSHLQGKGVTYISASLKTQCLLKRHYNYVYKITKSRMFTVASVEDGFHSNGWL